MKKSILEFLERHDDFVILIHSNADPDAVGSAVALKEFLRLRNKSATICCESANRMSKDLLQNLGEAVTCTVEGNAHNIIILDTASSSQLGNCAKILDHANHVVVIDHHRDSSFKEYQYLKEERTSTAEILFDLLPERNKKINLALMAGILTDTGNFKYANRFTLQTVLRILEEGIELYEVFNVFREEKDIPKRIAMVRGCQRAKLHKISGYLIITTRVNSHESSTATLLTQVADIAFVANGKANRIIAKAAQDINIDLSRIMKEIGQQYNGDGGGHLRAAGATGESITDALDHCVDLVREILEKK
ncbi:MAG: DHH family phosphoesterase [Theionarchaea archaeon]|nr:DHH family phosphoesterase [Theionarchaea archaeon]